MLQRPIIRKGLAPGTARIWDQFAEADLVFANLECPLTDRGAPADKHVAFRAEPVLARQLRMAGIDVVTLANNHTFDYGLEGMYDTLEALSRAAVAAVGVGHSLTDAVAPAVISAKGLRVAFLGLATTLPVGSGAGPDRPGVAPIRVTTTYVVDATATDETPGIAPFVETRPWPADLETAMAAVSAAKEQADVCVVGIHWGVPNGFVAQFQDALATYQRPMADALVEAGADVIAGHHPHVLHGVELINGRPVFYSLGNFLFHVLTVGKAPALRRTDPHYLWRSLRSKINLDSVIALVTCAPGAVTEIELLPALINQAGEPELVDGDDAVRILAGLTEQSAALGTTITLEGSRGRVAMPAVGAPR
jgi:poly-gamma-glutamate synthesis protein (capsule biosynthesis protein)